MLCLLTIRFILGAIEREETLIILKIFCKTVETKRLKVFLCDTYKSLLNEIYYRHTDFPQINLDHFILKELIIR